MNQNRILLMIIVTAYLLGMGSAFWVDWRLALVIASNCLFVSYLTLAVLSFNHLNGKTASSLFRKSAEPDYVIFLMTVAVVASGLLALFRILSASADEPVEWLVLALLSIPLGWATLHMMAAYQYAKLFWSKLQNGENQRGLEFPNESNPDSWDFVYFSFVIGMAAQTADVSISGRPLRRFVLAHSIVAYFYNAVLIAAAVNIAVATN